MDIVVKSLNGTCQLSGLQPNLTVQELKTLLQDRYKTNGHNIPGPDNQRLIFKDNVLAGGTLQEAGLTTGDSIVLLAFKDHVPRSEPAPAPVPDAAAISAAIREEARRQGIEHQLTEEVPPRRSAHTNLTGSVEDMDQRLMMLVEALEGRLNLLRNRDEPGGGDDVPAPEAQEPLQVPEPTADAMAQITDMGFAEAVARKALLLTAGQVPAAIEWVLQHGDDPDAATPPTEEQLRAVYGPRQRGRAVGAAATPGGMLAQLVEMGFERRDVAAALAQFPSVELALPVLLQQREAAEAEEAAGGGAGRAAAAAPDSVVGTSSEDADEDEEEYHEGEGHYDEDSDDEDDEEFVEGAEEHGGVGGGGGVDSDDEDMEDIDTEDGVTIDGMPHFGSSDMEQILEGMARMDGTAADDLLMHLMEQQARMHEAANSGEQGSQGRGAGSGPGHPPASQGGAPPPQ